MNLFRYCVLLIYASLYVDMDVSLQSNLDADVGPDMLLVDEPGNVELVAEPVASTMENQFSIRLCAWLSQVQQDRSQSGCLIPPFSRVRP